MFFSLIIIFIDVIFLNINVNEVSSIGVRVIFIIFLFEWYNGCLSFLVVLKIVN